MKQLFCQLLLACLLAAVLPSAAWAEPENTMPPVSAAVFWPADRARPGEALPLVVVVEISEGFHINADARQIKPSDSFSPYPTKLAVAAADEGLHSEAPL